MRLARAIGIAALVAAVGAPAARAQFLPDGMQMMPRNSRPAFLFAAEGAGAYSSLTPIIGQTITCQRNSVATYEPDGGSGSRTTAAINTCRVEPSGLYVEGASTNNLLNSSSPATQTTASLATGSYTGWVEGTGSLAFTAGTTTATGLPCTATASSDCHFSITGAGTVVATVTGTLTAEQLEPLPFRTSYIATAGTVASRVADAITTASLGSIGTNWCLNSTVQFSWLDTTSVKTFLAIGSGANSAKSYLQTNNQFWGTAIDGSSASLTMLTNGIQNAASHEYGFCDASGTQSIYIDGTKYTDLHVAGSGSGVANLSAGLTIGGGTNPQHFSKVKICRSSNAGACQ